MLFLGIDESRIWRKSAGKVMDSGGIVIPVDSFIRPGLIPAFHYYIGTPLLS